MHLLSKRTTILWIDINEKEIPIDVVWSCCHISYDPDLNQRMTMTLTHMGIPPHPLPPGTLIWIICSSWNDINIVCLFIHLFIIHLLFITINLLFIYSLFIYYSFIHYLLSIYCLFIYLFIIYHLFIIYYLSIHYLLHHSLIILMTIIINELFISLNCHDIVIYLFYYHHHHYLFISTHFLS